MISAALVKQLREKTGAGLMDCKRALQKAEGDLGKAVDHLRTAGIAKAEKKAGRQVADGLVFSYIHPGAKLGVLLEVNCETDFVAKTDDFQQFVKDVAMHIAATAPRVIRREELSAEDVDREKGILSEQARQSGKPEHILEKIVLGLHNVVDRDRIVGVHPDAGRLGLVVGRRHRRFLLWFHRVG